jgi:hypothetical protein
MTNAGYEYTCEWSFLSQTMGETKTVNAVQYIHINGMVGVPVGEVDDQVHDDVGQQLLVDQLVHGAAPS